MTQGDAKGGTQRGRCLAAASAADAQVLTRPHGPCGPQPQTQHAKEMSERIGSEVRVHMDHMDRGLNGPYWARIRSPSKLRQADPFAIICTQMLCPTVHLLAAGVGREQ